MKTILQYMPATKIHLWWETTGGRPKSFATWIDTNGLKMNIVKTQLMVLCGNSKQKSAQSVCVRIGDAELPKQESVKYQK